MDSPIAKGISDHEIDIEDSHGSEEDVSKEVGETEVFATGEEGVNFRTVGWIRGV